MEIKKLGNTGIEVSPIGFGVLTVGNTQLDLPIDEGAELICHAMDIGINFFDTAQYYRTYPYIRRALQMRAYADPLPVISSKCLDASYAEMRDAVEEARSELDMDVIDIFLMHEVRHDHDFENRAGAWEYLNEAKAKGLVRAIGVSTHHADVAEQMAAVKECDILFPLINKDSLGIRYGAGPGRKEDMAAAIKANADAGKGVFAMKVFGGGNLTGDYLASLDYVSSLPGISSMMIGFGKKEEIDDAAAYAEHRLPEGFQPDTGSKKIHIDPGDCEGCGTCIRRCPNKAIRFNEKKSIAEVDHSICLTCGYCAPVCPVRAIIMY